MTTKPVTRIGVAGLGKMGLLHAAIYNGLPEVQVVAVADPSRAQREALKTYNPDIKTFSQPEAMLDSGKLDALVIATPVAMHVPIALNSVQRGIPFFMEKPLSLTALQAEALVDVLRIKPVPHMVGYVDRFVGTFKKAHEVIASGCLGSLHRVKGTMYVSQLFSRGSGWRYDPKKAGGGVLHSQGSHLLDLLAWYFGPVAHVNAETSSVYSTQVEDFAHVLLQFRSGLRGWIDCSWSVRFKRMIETTIEVQGENGSLLVNEDKVAFYLEKAVGSWPAGWTQLNPVDLYQAVPINIAGAQYTLEALTFLEALHNEEMPQPGVSQALHVQRIIDAAYASSRNYGAQETVHHESN